MAKHYTVKAGDTLSKIADKLFGDPSRWPEIYQANKDKIEDPDVIKVGMQLIVLADEEDEGPDLPKHAFE